jgi:hypothetical protein
MEWKCNKNQWNKNLKPSSSLSNSQKKRSKESTIEFSRSKSSTGIHSELEILAISLHTRVTVSVEISKFPKSINTKVLMFAAKSSNNTLIKILEFMILRRWEIT